MNAREWQCTIKPSEPLYISLLRIIERDAMAYAYEFAEAYAAAENAAIREALARINQRLDDVLKAAGDASEKQAFDLLMSAIQDAL